MGADQLCSDEPSGGSELNGLLEIFDGLIVLSLREICAAHDPIKSAEVRIEWAKLDRFIHQRRCVFGPGSPLAIITN